MSRSQLVVVLCVVVVGSIYWFHWSWAEMRDARSDLLHVLLLCYLLYLNRGVDIGVEFDSCLCVLLYAHTGYGC